MNDTVIAIVGAFFVIGITVGIITVIAMSAFRADRRGDPGNPSEYGPDRPLPDPGRPDTIPDDDPRWPGDVDNDFTGR